MPVAAIAQYLASRAGIASPACRTAIDTQVPTVGLSEAKYQSEGQPRPGSAKVDMRPCRGEEVEAEVIELHRHSDTFRLEEAAVAWSSRVSQKISACRATSGSRPSVMSLK